ncbi:MAG: hypothetical protein FD188_3193 [Ignavibacteria bacterium]|nr:MAG: hypothetical protein FD188_3193 [Ignavibacteria bacterium]
MLYCKARIHEFTDYALESYDYIFLELTHSKATLVYSKLASVRIYCRVIHFLSYTRLHIYNSSECRDRRPANEGPAFQFSNKNVFVYYFSKFLAPFPSAVASLALISDNPVPALA